MTGCDFFTADDAVEKSVAGIGTKGCAPHDRGDSQCRSGDSTGDSWGVSNPRDFPGNVEPNQHATAEMTTLVRGRVIDVYADSVIK